MPDPAPDFLAILEELAAQSVDFFVIGGVGAALQGRERARAGEAQNNPPHR